MRAAIATLLSCLLTSAAAAQTPFAVGPVKAMPGTIEEGVITISPRSGDQGTTIPFSVIHGVKPGPVVALVAGTHGMEYTPILACRG